MSGGGAPIVGIVGAGVVGSAVGRALGRRGVRIAWFDERVGTAVRAAEQLGGVVIESLDHLDVADAVVLAGRSRQTALAERFLGTGVPVVSTSDACGDVHTLLDLDHLATRQGVPLVVGAAMCPGLSGLLVAGLANALAELDEVHVAMHGTGGPDCARQHHDALGDTSVAWHDGDWIERPGGSGRELCWFPDPVGALDCYRAALPDPVLLRRAFPGAVRISARVSATRRDRLTARLPMLTPPRRDGDMGAVRVEVRGAGPGGERLTHVAGAGGRAGSLAGSVAALYAEAAIAGDLAPGVRVAGEDVRLAAVLLGRAAGLGMALQTFTGVARATHW